MTEQLCEFKWKIFSVIEVVIELRCLGNKHRNYENIGKFVGNHG